MAKLPSEDTLIAAFLTKYDVKGTRESYEISLRQLTTWLRSSDLGHVASMTSPHFDLYAEHMKASGLKQSTIRGKFITIRLFFEYLVSSGTIKESPIPAGWVPKYSTGPIDEPLLSYEQVRSLLDAAKSDWRADDVGAVIALAGPTRRTWDGGFGWS